MLGLADCGLLNQLRCSQRAVTIKVCVSASAEVASRQDFRFLIRSPVLQIPATGKRVSLWL